MKAEDLNTSEKNTWCPGCTNFLILAAVKQAVANQVNRGEFELKNLVGVSGVGCFDKIFDYLNINFFHALHGRTVPTMFGIKLGNPELKVIGFGGDGSTYSEGIAHLVHSCRYNPDETFMVFNNQDFSLTTGQATPLSEKGWVSPSTPLGVGEYPLNPLELALASGASFVARGFAMDIPHLTSLIEEAMKHKGFSFIDILQPCISYQNSIDYFKEHIYKLENHNTGDFNEAVKKAREWNYCHCKESKISIGIFYKENRPAYHEQFPQSKAWYKVKRKTDFKKTLERYKN